MRRVMFVAVLLIVVAIAAVAWAAGGNTLETYESNDPVWTRPVTVANFPDPQNVAGTVNVGNLPAVQQVSGSVEVTNLPTAGPQQVGFVGVTTQTLQGDAGKVAMNQACFAEFSGSRMAFSDEYANTINPPTIGVGAWIQFRPVLLMTDRTAIDAAGAVLHDDSNAEAYRFACANWTVPSAGGATVQPNGAIATDWCGTARPIACAAPVE